MPLQRVSSALPTNNVFDVFQAYAKYCNGIGRGGLVDDTKTAAALVRCFRDGKLGQWQLDDLGIASEPTGILPPQIPADTHGIMYEFNRNEDLDSSERPSVSEAVEKAVREWYATSWEAYEQATTESLSGNQQRKIKKEARADSLRSLAGHKKPVRRADRRILKAQERHSVWERSVGPSRFTEDRIRTQQTRRSRYQKRQEGDPDRVRPRRYRRAARELKKQLAEGVELPLAKLRINRQVGLLTPKETRRLRAAGHLPEVTRPSTRTRVD